MTSARIILLVMGVSGSGKTTIARKLAELLGLPFQEGDDLHSPAAVDKMRHGVALTDADRAPWLDRITAVADRWRAAGSGGVLTCSALRRAYRDRIIQDRHDVRIIYLHVDRNLLAKRLQHRHGHYMPASLLDSQLATLEPPSPDEHAIRIDASGNIEATTQAALHQISAALNDPESA